MSTKATWPFPQRPVRWCVITFGVCSLLIVVTTPFMYDIPRSAYLFGGIAYSAYLAVCGVGFTLLGPKTGKLLFFPIVAVSFCLLLALFLPVFLFQERGLEVLDWLQPVAYPLFLVLILVFTAASFYGWFQHYRHR